MIQMNLKNEKVGILDMVESKAKETTLLKSIYGYNRHISENKSIVSPRRNRKLGRIIIINDIELC